MNFVVEVKGPCAAGPVGEVLILNSTLNTVLSKVLLDFEGML